MCAVCTGASKFELAAAQPNTSLSMAELFLMVAFYAGLFYLDWHLLLLNGILAIKFMETVAQLFWVDFFCWSTVHNDVNW